MPIGPARMPFLSHIGELRKRLTIVFGVLLLSSIGLYFFTPQIYGFVTRPVASLLKEQPTAIGWLEPDDRPLRTLAVGVDRRVQPRSSCGR